MNRTVKYLSYGAVAVLIVMMTAATVVERFYGTTAALKWFYHNPVFIVLWAVAAVAGLVYQFRRPMKLFTTCLHIALVVILAGALVTHLFGESGSIHLREGEDSSTFELDDGAPSPLPFGLRLESFAIDYYPGTRRPSDYRSVVTFLPEEVAVEISMNHIAKYRGYRFYQADYDEDGKGSILAVSHDPWGVGITYAGYLLLLLSMIGFFFQKGTWFRANYAQVRIPRGLKVGLRVTGALLLLGCFWLMCRNWIFKPLVPVLRSPLLWIHVASMIICYTLFALIAVNGIIGLLSPGGTRARLQNWSLSVLYPAVFILTFGTFIGAVWANISWGNYWAWDPKETWALITLLVYSFPLHGPSLKVFRSPRFFHWYAILAFLCVLITYFGVNLLLGGVHSYA